MSEINENLDLEVTDPVTENLDLEAEEAQDVPAIELNLDLQDSVSVKSAEAWAVGQRGGEPVASTDVTWHNNAKYYSEQTAAAIYDAESVVPKINNMTVEAATLAAGESATATISEVSGHKHIAFGIPAGPVGATGATGATGEKGDKGDQGDPAPAEEVTEAVDAYLAENFSNPSNPPLDRTLTSELSAAPADIVGEIKEEADQSAEDIIRIDGTKANTANLYNYAEGTPGSVVTVEDAVAEAVKWLKIEVAPIQNLNGYDYPWIGGSGKNKWNPDGTGTEWLGVDATTPSDRTGAKSMRFSCSEGDKIAVSMENTSTSSNILLIATLDSNGEKLTRTVVNTGATSLGITAGTNATQFLVSFFTASETGWVQVEFGTETATSYAPYSNICPISGRTGANVTRCRKVYRNADLTFTDGRITDTGAFNTSSSYKHTQMIPVKEGDIIHVSSSYTIESGHYMGRCAYDENLQPIMSSLEVSTRASGTKKPDSTVTMPEGAKYWCWSGCNQEVNSNTLKIVVAENVYSITFPSEAGTVYGGEIALNDDGTGSLVVDTAYITKNGSENSWVEAGSGNSKYFALNIGTKGSVVDDEVISDCYAQKQISGSTTDVGIRTINSSAYNAAMLFVRPNDVANTSLSSFKSALETTNLHVVYWLATPVTYTLTAQQVKLLLGLNNVWSADGNITEFIYPIEKMYDKSAADIKFAGAIEQSITTPAAVQTFSDGADGIPMELTVEMEPVQDLHGYDNPWVGGSGKNLADPSEFVNGGIDGSSGTINTSATTRVTTGFIPVTAGSTYVVSIETGKKFVAFHYYKSDKSNIAGNVTTNPYTVPSDASYVRVMLGNSDDSSIVKTDITSAQVELGSTATSYEPYSNICPISGWTGANIGRTGKNLIPGGTNTGNGYIATTYLKSDGTTSSGTDTFVSEYFRVKPSTDYVFHYNATSNSPSVCFYDEYKNFIIGYNINQQNNVSITTPANAYYARSTGIYTGRGKPPFMLTEGTENPTVDEWYDDNTVYSITFPTPPGTVYGGTLKVNKDGTGTLVVEKGIVDLGTLTWTFNQHATLGDYFYAIITSLGVKYEGKYSVTVYDAICSNYECTRRYVGIFKNCTFTFDGSAGSVTQLQIQDSAYSDAAAFKTAMSGVQLVYELATPVTYTLTAEQVGKILSLKGQNNVWCDAGNITNIEWTADTKQYIDQLFASITSAEGVEF